MARSDWQLQKTEQQSKKGMVIANNPLAAHAGRKVLAEGGNAIDAAVATALAVGVAEPMMSGIGGGGYLVYYEAKTGKVQIVNYSMRASQSAHDSMYELDESGGYSIGLFAWRLVKGNANVQGPKSVALPGTPAGLSLALEKFGSGKFSWAQLLQPAIKLADEGFYLDWYGMLRFLEDFDLLNRYPDTAAVFMPKGRPPMAEQTGRTAELFKQPALANTLKQMAQDGAGAFYKGDIARHLAKYITGNGGALTEQDLAQYQAEIEEPLAVPYGDYILYTTGKATGGTTMAQAIKTLALSGKTSGDLQDPQTWHNRIEALRLAFADRFLYLADPAFVDVPYAELLSDEYLAGRAAQIGAKALPYPAPAGRVGKGEFAYGPKAGESTTHLVVVDEEHNMVSITQTLLSLFGSGVCEPNTGVLLNNGMMWFDPEPGKANSVQPGKRPLSNMSPAVAAKNGKPFFTVGASGGRRIISAVAQIFLQLTESNITGAQAAIDTPRFDVSQPTLTTLDGRTDPTVLNELEAMGHKLQVTEESVMSNNYAKPMVALITEDGTIKGGSERWHSGFPAGI
jgi:gamma-glutamyltranspeptidase / glutathione hydrolase